MANFNFPGLKLTAEGQKYVNELNKLANMEICVGFQAGDGSYENGTDIVDIASYNEFGTSTIPARPFMQQSWENHESELQSACEEALASVSNGGGAQEACDKIGAIGVKLVQQEIVDGGFVPNAPSTVLKKGSAQPLIDTGTMRQSVHYVVRGAGSS